MEAKRQETKSCIRWKALSKVGRETEGDKMGVEFAITDKMIRKHAFDEGVLKQREPQRM